MLRIIIGSKDTGRLSKISSEIFNDDTKEPDPISNKIHSVTAIAQPLQKQIDWMSFGKQ